MNINSGANRMSASVRLSPRIWRMTRMAIPFMLLHRLFRRFEKQLFNMTRIRRLEQGIHRVEINQLPAVQKGRRIALGDLVHDMGGDDHRDPLLFQRMKTIPYRALEYGIDPHSRLIQQQKPWFV